MHELDCLNKVWKRRIGEGKIKSKEAGRQASRQNRTVSECVCMLSLLSSLSEVAVESKAAAQQKILHETPGCCNRMNI